MIRRPRFSLINLLLVITIVAFGVALYRATVRLRTAEAELARLRSEAGRLTIDDPKRVHVIAVPRAGDLQWRWRLHLPGGHDYAIYGYKGKLTAAGLPTGNNVSLKARFGGRPDPNYDREVLIDAQVGPNSEGGYCFSIAENGVRVSVINLGEELPDWAAGRAMFSEKVTGRGSTVSSPADDSLPLIRLDGRLAGGTSADALLIWIGKWQDDKAAIESLAPIKEK